MSLDYEYCATCGGRGYVIDSRKHRRLRYRRRRHACACGSRWTSYQSRVNPRRVLERISHKS
jgi:transcriptional regulator NrdR family protein